MNAPNIADWITAVAACITACTFNAMLGAVLLMVAVSASADMFAGFDSFCGLPVIEGSDPQTASARKDAAGRKFIHVDPGAMANWTMSRMFTLAHECAHHLLRHTDPIGEAERFYGGTARQELEADCWAAAKLRSVGYDSEITKTILERASEGHFSSGGYPSGAARAQNIIHCSGGFGVSPPICHNKQVAEPYTDIQVVMQPVKVACQHCGCNPYGQCGCMHQFHFVQQAVQVPVQRTRLVTRQVCD